MSRAKTAGILIGLVILIFLVQVGLNKGKDVPAANASKEKKGSVRIITDMQGRQVAIADPLERIALLGGPTGQVAFILGVQDKLCAVTNTLKLSKLVQQVYPQIKNLPGPRTTAGSINIEELIQADPQVVVTTEIDGNIVKAKTRIPVALLDDSMGEGIADIKKEVRFYAYVFNTPGRARSFEYALDELTRLVQERTKDIPDDKKKIVFQGYSPSHLVTLGGDTFMQERIEMAGCKNAAESVTTIGKRTGLHSGLGEVSMEQVIAWDPDILVINYGGHKNLAKDPQWRNIKAVKQGRVLSQPAGIFIFNRPTAESAAIFPLWLASVAYPERFKDIDVIEQVRHFYQKVMQIDLSAAQAQDILSGAYEFKMMKGIKHRG